MRTSFACVVACVAWLSGEGEGELERAKRGGGGREGDFVIIKFHFWNLSGYSDLSWEGKNLCGVVLGVKGTKVNARGEGRRKI